MHAFAHTWYEVCLETVASPRAHGDVPPKELAWFFHVPMVVGFM